MHTCIPWWGHLLNYSLNFSQASKRVSSIVFLKEVMPFPFLALRIGGKYFTKNLSASYLQVETELGSQELNQDLALSLREMGAT